MSLCLLCPGQGSQSPEMFGKLLADALLAEPLRRLLPLAGEDLLAIAADESRCYLNPHAQPLIVLYGLVVLAALDAAGVVAERVAGYSVGELTAHAAAGALGPAEVLQLAHARAACMDAATPAGFGMLAVRGVSLSQLTGYIAASGVVLAIRNAEDHAVLAGPRASLAPLAARLAGERGAHVVPLRISVPAHSHWLATGVAGFADALGRVRWQAHRMPVLCGIDAHAVDRAADARATLSRQIAEPIDWARVLDTAVEMGTRVFFEIGPGNGLARMARERFPELAARALDDFAGLQGALAWLQRSLAR